MYMALVMGASMAVIMLSFMLKKYTNVRVNTAFSSAAPSYSCWLSGLFADRQPSKMWPI